MKHFRSWGAVYILVLMWAFSWAMQAWTMLPEIEKEGGTRFWAATLANLQSAWLQLAFQGMLLLGAKHWIFQADARDLERIEQKIDRVLESQGRTSDQGF